MTTSAIRKCPGRGSSKTTAPIITAQTGIAKTIRKKLVEDKMLAGVISMPSNIFAKTGTNVSVLFIDKANQGDVILIDASQLGEEMKDGKNQRTVLNDGEIDQIINTFSDKKVIEDFSVLVTYEKIRSKNYSMSAQQHFDIKIHYEEISQTEFLEKIDFYNNQLNDLFSEGEKLHSEIKRNMKFLNYE